MPRKLHIAFFTYFFWPEIGAPSLRLLYNARYFASQGHRVTILTTFPNYPFGIVQPAYRGRVFQDEQWEGCEILRGWTFTSPNRNFVNRLKSFLTLQVTANLMTFPRLANPDAVFVEAPPMLNGASAALWRYLKGAAIVLHLSDLEVRAILEFGILPKFAEPPLLWFQRTVMNLADHVVTVSDYCKEDLLRAAPPADRTTVIPNGVDVDLFTAADDPRPWRERLGLPFDKTIAIYAGTHGHVHGVEQIAEAARQLQNEPIFILMVGGGVGKAAAVAKAEAYGLSNIRFLPPQPLAELPMWLNAADFGLSTLVNQEMNHSVIPVKMLSYMACGLPMISSDRRHCRQIMEEAGGAGVLVPAGDTDALARAIREMAAETPRTRHEMGRCGREYVVKDWSRRRQAERLLEATYAALEHRRRA